MTFRTEAGESVIGISFDRLREPTGSPVARYDSTIWRKISRERSSSCARPGFGIPMGGSIFMRPIYPIPSNYVFFSAIAATRFI